MKIYSVADVALKLGLSANRVRKLANSRKLGSKLGGNFIFTYKDIKNMAVRHPGRPKKEK